MLQRAKKLKEEYYNKNGGPSSHVETLVYNFQVISDLSAVVAASG
jgi:hypothetical protein